MECLYFLTDVSREGIDGLQDGQNCFFVDKNNMAEVISKALTDKVRLKRSLREERNM